VQDQLDRHTTVITTRHRQGEVRVTSSPRTPTEQESLDQDIDEYLEAAGAPARPPGQRWLIRLPQRCGNGEEFFSAIEAAITAAAPSARHPAEFVVPLTQCLASMYADSEP
jgi:hypothetical protein